MQGDVGISDRHEHPAEVAQEMFLHQFYSKAVEIPVGVE